MKTSAHNYKVGIAHIIFTVVTILFWLYVGGSAIYSFSDFKGEINNQVFPIEVSAILIYALPTVEIIIATLLVFEGTRYLGMKLSFLLMLGFTVYIALVFFGIFNRTPCSCAGLLGKNSTWENNFMLNVLITIIAGIGLLLTFKDKERRKIGMDTLVSHAHLTA